MEIKIDINEIFPEVTGCTEGWCNMSSIAESLKDDIVFRVKNDMLKDIRAKTEEIVSSSLKDQLNKTIDLHVNARIEEILSLAKVKGRYVSDEPKTIHEYCIERVEELIANSDIEAIARKTASKYAETIKDRFDKVFASALLDKMMKNGLLKDDRIASLLITSEETER